MSFHRIKPILFNTEMVRALLAGRKTVTRRRIKPSQMQGIAPDRCPNHTPEDFVKEKPLLFTPYCNMTDEDLIRSIYKAPYQVGDILFVRETWARLVTAKDGEMQSERYVYKATDEYPFGESGYIVKFRWKPSIHMPKEAARIWLKVTDVRVERLQDIDGRGAEKEGMDSDMPITNFIQVWNSTIKKQDLDSYGWDANPWVFVVSFEKIEKEKL